MYIRFRCASAQAKNADAAALLWSLLCLCVMVVGCDCDYTYCIADCDRIEHAFLPNKWFARWLSSFLFAVSCSFRPLSLNLLSYLSTFRFSAFPFFLFFSLPSICMRFDIESNFGILNSSAKVIVVCYQFICVFFVPLSFIDHFNI